MSIRFQLELTTLAHGKSASCVNLTRCYRRCSVRGKHGGCFVVCGFARADEIMVSSVTRYIQLIADAVSLNHVIFSKPRSASHD